MAVFPGAVWRGNCANNSGLRGSVTRGLVLHVNDTAANVSLWSWVNNPNSDMSCHFQVLQDGTVEQYLDTDLWSWCQADGNRQWISMEMPTLPSVGMTSAQIKSAARVLKWLSDLYHFPLELTSDPTNGQGFGWHGMGGAAWGGHTGCPGDIRVAQRAQVLSLALATTTITPPKEDFDMPYSQWPAAEKAALSNDIVTAWLNHNMSKVPLDGGPFVGNLGELLWHTLLHAKTANLASTSVNNSVSDPKSGALVRIASLQAELDKIVAQIQSAPDGTSVDEAALSKAVIRALAAGFTTSAGV